MTRFAVLVGLAACATGTDDSEIDAGCEPTDNALRFLCSAELPEAAEATWTVMDGDVVLRTFRTDSARESETVLWGLVAEHHYAWKVAAGGRSATGDFTTDHLPDDLRGLQVESSGTSVAEPSMLVAQICDTSGYLLIVDTAGDVLWYETVIDGGDGGAPGAGFGGYSWTDEGTILVTIGRDKIRELAPSGELLMSASGFDRPIHHDLFRGGDYVYALNAAIHDDVIVDGLYVLDRDGSVAAEWDLYDHVDHVGTGHADGFWRDEFGNTPSWSHGNSIWSDGHDAMVSLRFADTVLKLDSDPLSATFGDIEWTLTSGVDDVFVSDFALDGEFSSQHAAAPVDGGIVLFDNEGGSSSRGLKIAMDEAGHTADVVREYPTGQHCDVQGGVYPVGDGGMLVTCATFGWIGEFEGEASEPVWQMNVHCGDQIGGAVISRAIPVVMP